MPRLGTTIYGVRRPVTIRVPGELYEHLQRRCAEEKLPIQRFVADALSRQLGRTDPTRRLRGKAEAATYPNGFVTVTVRLDAGQQSAMTGALRRTEMTKNAFLCAVIAMSL